MNKHKEGRHIYVYADWEGMNGPQLMGVLHSQLLRGNEIFSFEYDENWLKAKQSQLLDPELQFYAGRQYLAEEEKPNFGVFLDSSPDRWGRILMKRREAALARKEGRKVEKLFETDYLLGVYDGHRMGALRFKEAPEGPFLNDNEAMATPPWTSIRELEEISLKLEEEKVLDDPEYLKWLNMLMAPGSSLGGARPKAGVLDQDNHLWIAKFPSLNDTSDIGGWELVAHELAKASGLNVAEAMAKKFSSNYHTFLTKRFDRSPKGERIHFASAMTLLGHKDGDDFQAGVSYLELVEFIMSHGAKAHEDLEELWRRIVFSICISNTDDHLRNHGFLLSASGWVLSPAYDLNPVETGTGLKLNISEDDNALDLELALEVHEYFYLDKKRAREIIDQVKGAVSHWRKTASRFQLSRIEQELKESAFRY